MSLTTCTPLCCGMPVREFSGLAGTVAAAPVL